MIRIYDLLKLSENAGVAGDFRKRLLAVKLMTCFLPASQQKQTKTLSNGIPVLGFMEQCMAQFLLPPTTRCYEVVLLGRELLPTTPERRMKAEGGKLP